MWFDDVFATEPKMVRNRFARVIFGVTSSPFLLNGTVRSTQVIIILTVILSPKLLIRFLLMILLEGKTQ